MLGARLGVVGILAREDVKVLTVYVDLSVICVCLRIVMSNAYSVVFLFCLSSSCVPYVASFSGLSILIAPSVFS
jgi:hypothetical protein